jgi:hypothetical protein
MKNGEMKRFHGLARARGYGLESASFQAKLTAIAVDLKRIAAIIGGIKPDISSSITSFATFISKCHKKQKSLMSVAA